MKRTRIALVAGVLLAFVQSHAQVSITTGGTYNESLDGLATAGGVWADNSTLPGWYAAVTNVGTAAFTPYSAFTATAGGASSSTVLYAMRQTSSSTDYALGGVPSATAGRTMLGWRLLNADSVAITNLVLTYDGEEWRRDTPTNTFVYVSYRIFNAGEGSLAVMDGWTDAPASLTFGAFVAGTAGAINGNDAANRAPGLTASITNISLLPGKEIWFKWYFVKIGGGGFMLGVDNAKVEVPVGTPPIIGSISNITVKAGQTSVIVPFTVNDAEDDAASIPLGTPTAISSNESALPSANIYFGGTGSNRTVYVVGGSTAGTVDVTVSLADSNGNVGRQTFTVIVRPANTAPVFGTIRWTNTLHDASVPVPVIVQDEESAATELNLTGAVASYSAGILSSVQITSDPNGTNRTVTVTPAPGATGVGVVNLTLDDLVNTNQASFSVMVLPDGNTVFIDHFDYPVNSGIIANSPGFWLRRNSSSQAQAFATISDGPQALIKPLSNAEDAAAPLAYGPFAPGSGAVLFTMVKAQWVDLGLTPGNSSGPFILLAPTSGASADQLMQVGTQTNGVDGGPFRLHISNGANSYTALPTDLSVGSVYNIVVRYDVDSAKAALWVDGTSEISLGVSATDAQDPTPAGFVCIRQEPDMGYIYMDDLKVVAIRKPLITSISAPSSGNVEILFTAGAGDVIGDFSVERTTSVTGAFGGVGAAITSLGNGNFKAVAPSSGDQSFYRIKRAPFVF